MSTLVYIWGTHADTGEDELIVRVEVVSPNDVTNLTDFAEGLGYTVTTQEGNPL